MISSNPMTREELLEAAALDALGLLDRYETDLFTRSLLNAPAVVREEIIQLQAALVTDPMLLSDDEPDPSLRRRVLHAVNDAIELQTGELAPLATIGPDRPVAVTKRERFRLNFSNLFWRAATFMLTGAVVVLAYFWSVAHSEARHMADLVLRWRTDQQVKEMIGRDYLDFVNSPTATEKVLTPVAAGLVASGATYVNENSKDGFMLVIGLKPSTEQYSVRVVEANGTTHHLRKFIVDQAITAIRFDDMALAALGTLTWEITDSAGAVVMRSA